MKCEKPHPRHSFWDASSASQIKCITKDVFLAALTFTLFACGETRKEKVWTRLPDEAPSGEMQLSAPMPASAVAGQMPPASGGFAPRMSGGTGMPPTADRSRVIATTGSLVASGVGFMIPDGWVPETPKTPMRLAQYRLPGSAGDAELSVFAFGPGQGGTPKANIERWVAQFRADEATTGSQPAEVAELETGGLRLYLVKTWGTYTPTAMGMGGDSTEPLPNYALFGVVVEGGPEGLLFVKVTGPKPTLDAQAKQLESFVRSVKLIK
ncbi:MAG: hypothetical protein ACP5UB_11520 [Candidatus Sumerlaeaceae bacterium]|jgi:hypothetical protein